MLHLKIWEVLNLVKRHFQKLKFAIYILLQLSYLNERRAGTIMETQVWRLSSVILNL